MRRNKVADTNLEREGQAGHKNLQHEKLMQKSFLLKSMLSHKHDGKQMHDFFDLFALFSGAHDGSHLHKSKLLRATFYMVYGFSTILYIWYLYHPLMHTLVLAIMSMIHAQWKSCSNLFKVWCEVYLSNMKVMITSSIGHLSRLTKFLK